MLILRLLQMFPEYFSFSCFKKYFSSSGFFIPYLVLNRNMEKPEEQVGYRVWAMDNYVYGPVEIPMIVQWIKEGRIFPDVWIYIEHRACWEKAKDIPELKFLFKELTTTQETEPSSLAINLKPQSLRRIKIFTDFTDDQLTKFLNYLEMEEAPQFKVVLKQGDPGDSMYLILEGELRVRLMIGGKETTLTTLQTGEFFGDISLFDRGPRAADVVANTNSKLLKLSVNSFERLMKDLPELCAPFLYAIAKTLIARIRADDRRIYDSISFVRAGLPGIQK